MLGCGKSLARVAAEFLGNRCLVGLHNQFPKRAGVLVLAGKHVQQRSPQIGISAEPVENATVEQAHVEQSGGGTVQAVLAALAVAEAIRLLQWAVPGMPDTAVGMLDMQINRDLADVMQQRRIGGAGSPGLGLCGLCFWRDAGRKQIGLPQLEGVGHDLEAMIQHAARIGVVVAF
ncbi:hypothetical protein D3C81_598900 [compost metagenome]